MTICYSLCEAAISNENYYGYKVFIGGKPVTTNTSNVTFSENGLNISYADGDVDIIG